MVIYDVTESEKIDTINHLGRAFIIGDTRCQLRHLLIRIES